MPCPACGVPGRRKLEALVWAISPRLYGFRIRCVIPAAGLAGLSRLGTCMSLVCESNLEKSSNDNRNTKNVGAPAPPPARRANTKTPLVVHSSFSNARAFKGGAVVIRFRRLSYALGG